MINRNDIVKMICPNCGKEYEADAKRLKYGRQTTCSRACSYAIRSANIANSTLFHCATCGKELWKSPSQVEKIKHGSVFCSRACHYAGRSTGATKRIVTKPYTYTEEGKAAMIASVSAPKGKRTWHMLTCVNCGKEFDDPRDGRKRKSGMAFCSLDCCNAYRKGEHNPSWRGGYDSNYGYNWKSVRKAARKRDDYTCQRCHKEMKPPHRAPDVHHISPIGTFDSPLDANYLENLVCLCHECHMFVEWHGIDFAL